MNDLNYAKPYTPPMPKLSATVCILFAASAAAYAACRMLGAVGGMYLSATLSGVTGTALFGLIVYHVIHRKRSKR